MTYLRIQGSLALVVSATAFVWSAGCGSSGDDGNSGSDNLGTAASGGSAADGSGGGAGGGSASGAGTSASGGTGTGTSGAGGLAGSGGLSAIVESLCGTEGCQCSNGIDDDGDGQIDGFDAECTGALDDDEGTFATGISGDNKDPKWQDCFFDGNSGAGDDDCRYHTDCILGILEDDDPSCVVSDACLEFCAARTPNGCDCFGCCEVSDGDGNRVNIYLDISCSEETIDDVDACPRCTPSTQCGNTCGSCELCPGKTVEDLPDTCQPDPPPDPPDGEAPVEPPPYTCDNNQQVCSLEIACPLSYYCQQGCCLPILR
jgi:hypothetical protein